MSKTKITVAYGDGIGPEIMDATLKVILAAGAQLDIETIEIGEKVYLKGVSAGIEDSSWESLKRTKVFLKAPITTPQGSGFKSLNVTVRKMLGLYANVRPCVAYAPFVATKHPGMDVVIVRENEEDLYAGVEHRQTFEMTQTLKLISRPGCEKIVRYAFEYAKQNGRKKVTCFTKDNIMKLTDGLFHQVFNEIAQEYPEITNEHWIVDIGAAKMADTPEEFDVIVMPNLYGDILSDVAAQIAGSVGLAGSSNIGELGAMFEAIHGSAPRRAGQNLANPSGLLLAAVMMLNHIGQNKIAEKVHNAWLTTIESGLHTYDIFTEGVSQKKLGTREFAEAVIQNLGQKPQKFKPITYQESKPLALEHKRQYHSNIERLCVGVDVFACHHPEKMDDLVAKLQQAQTPDLQLTMVSNRGIKVWPKALLQPFTTDHWRCRFKSQSPLSHQDIVALMQRLQSAQVDFVKTEGLYTFDGAPGYSLGQGE
jgi:isocitrate dehydrogenase